MGYDEHLADRIRACLDDEPGAVEKRMFGGLAFLVGGHMAVAANRKGVLMVRVDPDDAPALIEAPGVERMVMGGREMAGWPQVSQEACAEDADLTRWVERGLAVVHDLPPKTSA